MQADLILIFVLLWNCFLIFALEDQKIYFRGVFCNFSDEYFFPNHSSRAKSFNRSYSTITIVATTRNPIHDISVRNFCDILGKINLKFGKQLQISYDYKYGNIYRDVVHTPTFDFCEVTKAGSSNPLISQLIPQPKYRKNIDELTHECPYQVKFIQIEFDSTDILLVYSAS